MIEVTELMIGNWVSIYGSHYQLYHVLQAAVDVGKRIVDSSQVPIKYVEPIPLTPEILKKAGFEWSVWHQAHSLNGFDYVIEQRSHYWSVQHGKRGGLVICDIKYVHQLQNLYYLLTNTELNISL